MTKNFSQRIKEIWAAHLLEQQSLHQDTNTEELEPEVVKINAHFTENLMVQTESYLEKLKERVYREVYSSLAERNSAKLYLDNEIRVLMEHDYSEIKSRNETMRQEVKDTKARCQLQIDQTILRFEKAREKQILQYDREFCFKLNGNETLVTETLSKALPILQAKSRRLDAKLVTIGSKNDSKIIEQLKAEIAALEVKLSYK